MILPDCITDSVVRAKYSSDISTSGLKSKNISLSYRK